MSQNTKLDPHEMFIPEEMRALVLDGSGWNHLAVRRVRVPRPGPRELLARVDCAGICTSLLKLIDQGPDHPLMYGRDITRYPAILGDEGSITLVEIGAALTERFFPGQRFVMQPAIDHAPINDLDLYRDRGHGISKVAAGYTLPGHLAEYILVSEEALAASCLIPIPDPTMPFAHAALTEPLSCAVSSQEHHLHLFYKDPLSPRSIIKGIKPGGVLVVIGAGVMGRMHIDIGFTYSPRVIVVSDLIKNRLACVENLFRGRAQKIGIHLRLVQTGQEDITQVVSDLTDGLGADDVIVAVGSPKAITSAEPLVGRGGVLNLFGGMPHGQEYIPFNTQTIHYGEINITGSSGGYPWDMVRTLELIAAGTIDPAAHITRIGDLDHAPELLNMVKMQSLDGKAIVYPHQKTSTILSAAHWSGADEQSYLSGK
jgi:threonine dehydrogenase-like Zn-dependent dehydrogenase